MKLARLALGLYLATLLTATHWPKLNVNPESGLRLDLLIHCGAFGVLTVLLALARVFDKGWLTGRNIALSGLAATAIAGFDELTQTLEPFGRVTDVGDYAADLVGIALAMLALVALARVNGRKTG